MPLILRGNIDGSFCEPLNPQNESSNIHFGGRMRNYTYIDGTRFIVVNLFRSLRYDIDRLDMSWVGDQKPIFSRGSILVRKKIKLFSA
jgi:hypothetical protein